jgi:hypothetical protein
MPDSLEEQWLARLRSALENILPFAEMAEDAGPPGEGWRSEELKAAISEAEAALAETGRGVIP